MKRYAAISIVERSIKIRRRRVLPHAGEIVANIGQELGPVQVVARAPREIDFRILPVSERLGISEDEVLNLMTVKVGDQVEAGASLMQHRRMWRKKKVVSPIHGHVYDVVNGRIILQKSTDWLELRALVRGRVASQVANRGVEIEVTGALMQAQWGSGKEAFGKLAVLAYSPEEPFFPQQLQADLNGRIIAVGIIDNEDALHKAEEAGIRGIIAASMSASLADVARELAIPIVLTDGWGRIPMAKPIFDMLRDLDEQELSLFANADYALGERPEIIVPHSEIPKTTIADIRKPIAVGKQVRIIRPPYQGKMGTIVYLYRMSSDTPLGVKTMGADVVFDDGRRVFVPLANIDIMA